MKFGTLLRNSANETPELQNLYSCYKLLKKRLKCLPDRNSAGVGDQAELADRQHSFVMTLNEDVQQFNELFIEKEEESVIRLRSLEDEAKDAENNMDAIGKVICEGLTILPRPMSRCCHPSDDLLPRVSAFLLVRYSRAMWTSTVRCSCWCTGQYWRTPGWSRS